MSKKTLMKLNVHEISFEKDGDFLDIINHVGEGWIEIKTDQTGSFTFTSNAEIDKVAAKLKELLKQSK